MNKKIDALDTFDSPASFTTFTAEPRTLLVT